MYDFAKCSNVLSHNILQLGIRIYIRRVYVCAYDGWLRYLHGVRED